MTLKTKQKYRKCVKLSFRVASVKSDPSSFQAEKENWMQGISSLCRATLLVGGIRARSYLELTPTESPDGKKVTLTNADCCLYVCQNIITVAVSAVTDVGVPHTPTISPRPRLTGGTVAEGTAVPPPSFSERPSTRAWQSPKDD